MSITSKDGKIKATVTSSTFDRTAPTANTLTASNIEPTTTFLSNGSMSIGSTIEASLTDLKVKVKGVEEVVSDYYSIIDNN